MDVGRAAAVGTTLSGQWPLATLTRLADGAPSQGDQSVEWSARFEQRPVSGGAPLAWLQLAVHARVWRECQRCLNPVALDLHVERAFSFVPTEDLAAAQDAESEHDVLTLSRQFDLRALVEDELLLGLPLVAMHAQCPLPLPALAAADSVATQSSAGVAPAEAPPHPFAALAALKHDKGG